MVGLLMACALGDTALKVAVLDRRDQPPPLGDDFDLRVSAVTLASRAMFEAVGAWPAMERRRTAPFREMRVWESRANDSNAGSIHFDSAEIGEPCLGYIVENAVVINALLERLEAFTNVQYLAPAEISEGRIDEEAVRISLSDGRVLTARVLVGAEGVGSRVRRMVGIGVQEYDFDQLGIVATVATGEPHRDSAWQVFTPSGPLAFLPLPEPRTCSIVWSVDSGRAHEVMAFDDDGFARELQTAFGDVLGEVRPISARAAFPLALAHAQAYVAARVALIGDAAHVVHPLAGQGVNLGFLDAAALSEVLLNAHGRARDIGSIQVLRRFERWRKGGNLAMLAVTAGFKEVFGSPWSAVRTARGMGLNFADAAQPLKNWIMRRASGLHGDVPALARRRPIG